MNKAALDKLLADFYTVTNMEISVLDSNMHTVSQAKRPGKSLCADIQRADGAVKICKASDIEKLLLARDSTAPIVYTCPFGITEAIVPVVRDESVIAYVFSAMGLREGDEPRMNDTTATVSSEKIEAVLSMMKLLAEHLSVDETLIEGDDSIGALTKYYVRKNLSRKITLSDIALYLHCSTVSVTEHFKREFGVSVMEYVTRKRMELAEELLLATDAPLREIGERVGFCDVEYFSRTFKRHYNISPGAYRKNNINKIKESKS